MTNNYQVSVAGAGIEYTSMVFCGITEETALHIAEGIQIGLDMAGSKTATVSLYTVSREGVKSLVKTKNL